MIRPVIVGGARTAIGSFGGSLRALSASELGAVAVRAAIERAGIESDSVEEVVFGCVGQVSEDGYIARLVGIKAGLPVSATALGINRQCGSGLQAIVTAADSIALGRWSTIVAGGTEHMSGMPLYARQARWGQKTGPQTLEDGLLTMLSCPIDRWAMGRTAEIVAERYGISRADQDAFALMSQQRARQAIDSGFFTTQIAPVPVLGGDGATTSFAVDEHPRADTTLERLMALPPTFHDGGTVTPGNSSGINDGAAAMVLMDEEVAGSESNGPRLRLVASAVAGVEPAIMGMGPVPAIEMALARAGMDRSDIDLIELNEAFAAPSVAVIRESRLDPDRVNVNGGAIALGHPVGATGAILVVKLMNELERRDAQTGLVTLCIGGGQGIAAIFERVG